MFLFGKEPPPKASAVYDDVIKDGHFSEADKAKVWQAMNSNGAIDTGELELALGILMGVDARRPIESSWQKPLAELESALEANDEEKSRAQRLFLDVLQARHAQLSGDES